MAGRKYFKYFEERKGRKMVVRKYLLWMGLILLLVILTACGGSSSNAPTITPLALTATPHKTASPTMPPTKDTDWTTYHGNNQRTGYVASTPDPRSLKNS